MIYTWLVTPMMAVENPENFVDFPASSWNADFLETQFSGLALLNPKKKGPVEILDLFTHPKWWICP